MQRFEALLAMASVASRPMTSAISWAVDGRGTSLGAHIPIKVSARARQRKTAQGARRQNSKHGCLHETLIGFVHRAGLWYASILVRIANALARLFGGVYEPFQRESIPMFLAMFVESADENGSLVKIFGSSILKPWILQIGFP